MTSNVTFSGERGSSGHLDGDCSQTSAWKSIFRFRSQICRYHNNLQWHLSTGEVSLNSWPSVLQFGVPTALMLKYQHIYLFGRIHASTNKFSCTVILPSYHIHHSLVDLDILCHLLYITSIKLLVPNLSKNELFVEIGGV